MVRSILPSKLSCNVAIWCNLKQIHYIVKRCSKHKASGKQVKIFHLREAQKAALGALPRMVQSSRFCVLHMSPCAPSVSWPNSISSFRAPEVSKVQINVFFHLVLSCSFCSSAWSFFTFDAPKWRTKQKTLTALIVGVLFLTRITYHHFPPPPWTQC